MSKYCIDPMQKQMYPIKRKRDRDLITPQCICGDKYCGIIARFLQRHVQLLQWKSNTRKPPGFNAIHYPLVVHQPKSNGALRGIKSKNGASRALSCHEAIQVTLTFKIHLGIIN